MFFCLGRKPAVPSPREWNFETASTYSTKKGAEYSDTVVTRTGQFWLIGSLVQLIMSHYLREEPSLSYYLLWVLVLCEMQSVSPRVWTRVAVSISYDDNHYNTGTSIFLGDSWIFNQSGVSRLIVQSAGAVEFTDCISAGG